MNRRWKKSSMRCGKALTLIEAVAGLALLASVLVAVVIAAGRFNTASALANHRIEACNEADKFLSQYLTDMNQIPRNASGEVETKEGWSWRTSVSYPDSSDQILNMEMVTFEIIDDNNYGEVLVKIELPVLKIGPQEDADEKANEADGDDIGGNAAGDGNS